MDIFVLVAVVIIYLGVTVYLAWLGYKHTVSATIIIQQAGM